jgi:hypothetical protein
VASGWWLVQWEVRGGLGSGPAILFSKPHVVSRRGALATSHYLDFFCDVDEAFPLRGERMKLLSDRL